MPERSSSKKKRPSDVNQLAYDIVQETVSEEREPEEVRAEKDPAAVELVRQAERGQGQSEEAE